LAEYSKGSIKLTIMKSRRQFVKIAGTGILAAGVSTVYGSSSPDPVQAFKPADSFSIGMAGYTFREFTVDKTIGMMKRIGVTYLSLKDFHMPLNSGCYLYENPGIS
jgi:inosose dehydratase